jgi:hypothetical protein
MTLVATPLEAFLSCGRCGARFNFKPSIDRRLPIEDAFAAGWGAAFNDKGAFDHACPQCLAIRPTKGEPIPVPDDPPEPRQRSLTMPAVKPRKRRRPSHRS